MRFWSELRFWLELIGNSMLELAAQILIAIGKACIWLSYRILAPTIRRDVERMTRIGHLQQVIQDDLGGEPWDEFLDPEDGQLWEELRSWHMEHDDEKDDR